MEFANFGFDHIEFVVSDLEKQGEMWERLGFQKIGKREQPQKGLSSHLYGQGWVRILLTKPDESSSAAQKQYQTEFHKKHGDGICTLAVAVDDAEEVFKKTVERGARPALEPEHFEWEAGKVVRAEIWTPEDIRYAFMERETQGQTSSAFLFDEDLIADCLQCPSIGGIQTIDHLTNNVSIGEMSKWVDWYKQIFDFKVTRHFKINTGRTGLISDVVESQDGKIKVPVNEATEPESQVQEFVERFKGAGVQHLAFLTDDIMRTVRQLREQGFKFLKVPSTYYEEVPTRVPHVTEDLKDLENLNILLDGEESGYLMQIFTEEVMGPFFFEFIQRKGNRGFGEGNFNALFQAIERDQVRRGVLKK
jgi:4-hydroxyphenylpyruvate dioxygenase